MELMVFLIVFPLIVAALLLAVRSDATRKPIVYASALVIAAASVWLVVTNIGAPWTPFEASSAAVDAIGTVIGALVAICVIAYAVKYRNVLAGVLAGVQLAGSLAFELGVAHGIEVPAGLYLDSLTLVMVFIIGVVGSGICVYALGYMKDFQAHEPQGARDRRPLFFALMFTFLSAMFVIVFSDNMAWMFCGWEVTTLCSFLLIGFTKTEEAIRNAFRQIVMNILGGIAFLAALWYCASTAGTLSFAEFLAAGQTLPELAMFPACALAFAGMTKAAQMPFHTWLLGAMVAPTPTSALLHSSTMVKAGVFLLVKLAPVLFVCPIPRIMTILVGGVTFLLCSFMAISQSNAKRVLAYSTISNLGLITACAGVGTPEAVWAAIFLILFHAVAKSLLFLCVGTAEHHIGSRDIESMDLLFERMPRLSRYMMLGIMVMFIAPFGMLLAKWAALVSFADTGNAVLIIILAFGSAATFMFWAKWFGKLAGIAGSPENVERTVHGSEWVATTLMVVLACVFCIAIPLVSEAFVEPYIAGVFGTATQTLSDGNLWISAVAVLLALIVLLGGLGHGKSRKTDVYLSGVAVDDGTRSYKGSLGAPIAATSRNMYLEKAFGEKYLSPAGATLCAALMAIAFVVVLAPATGLL